MYHCRCISWSESSSINKCCFQGSSCQYHVLAWCFLWLLKSVRVLLWWSWIWCLTLEFQSCWIMLVSHFCGAKGDLCKINLQFWSNLKYALYSKQCICCFILFCTCSDVVWHWEKLKQHWNAWFWCSRTHVVTACGYEVYVCWINKLHLSVSVV